MQIVDANVILRYLLEDAEELTKKATEILENNKVFVPNEVIAEVVFVLEKVYKIERNDIYEILIKFFGCDSITVSDRKVIIEALNVYNLRRLDFVDTLLYSYNKIRKHKVFTFDKKLNNLLES